MQKNRHELQMLGEGKQYYSSTIKLISIEHLIPTRCFEWPACSVFEICRTLSTWKRSSSGRINQLDSNKFLSNSSMRVFGENVTNLNLSTFWVSLRSFDVFYG